MTAPRIESHSGGRCGYALVDNGGYSYPCDEPSVAVLINASERWGGPMPSAYCKRHINKAFRGATADMTEDDE